MGKQRKLIKRLHALLDHLEQLLPPVTSEVDWEHAVYQWREGRLKAVLKPEHCELDDLLCMDAQKQEVMRNLGQFVTQNPANHMLLWGARGTGKSTLLKAAFGAWQGRGLRLIEISAGDLGQLPNLAELIRPREERYLLFCDDLSFDADDSSYRSLKAMLEGSVNAPPDNLLICVTSNRRHLIPEFHAENQQTRYIDDEVHPGESVEEKISLSERFGHWLSFYPFRQEEYLSICAHWLQRYSGESINQECYRHAAVQWAQQRGSRSGRVARQFAIDYIGREMRENTDDSG